MAECLREFEDSGRCGGPGSCGLFVKDVPFGSFCRCPSSSWWRTEPPREAWTRGDGVFIPASLLTICLGLAVQLAHAGPSGRAGVGRAG